MTENNYRHISVDANQFCRALYFVVAVLSVIHIAMLCIYFWIDDEDTFDFIELIDLDYEDNIPTLFSAMLFFICGTLLLLLWRNSLRVRDTGSSGDSWQWLGLTAIFFFLGFDEGVKIHEYTGDMMEQVIDAKGFLYFPWFIPYLTIFFLLVVMYLPFYLRLPAKTQREFFIAAAVYLFGAVVLDILSAGEADENGTDTILYSAIYTVEEILEMIGLILFIKALFSLARQHKIIVSVR